MSRIVGEYTRVTGTPWLQGFVRGGVWLGEDELLAVKSHGYTEHYQRIKYADVQATVIRKTARRAIIGSVTGVPGVGALLGAVLASSVGVTVFWSVIAAFFLPIFLINQFKGPGAVMTVKTAVGNHRLPGVRRLRRAENAAVQLRAKVEERQGELTSERLAEAAERSEQRPAAPQAEAMALTAAPPPPLPVVGGMVRHAVIFTLITVQALLIAVRFFVDSLVLDIAIFLPAPVAFVLACLALSKWKRLPSVITGWLISALVYLGIMGMFVYFSATVAMELDRDMGRFRPEGSTVWTIVHFCFMAAAALVGVGGFLSSLNMAGRRPQPEAVSQVERAEEKQDHSTS